MSLSLKTPNPPSQKVSLLLDLCVFLPKKFYICIQVKIYPPRCYSKWYQTADCSASSFFHLIIYLASYPTSVCICLIPSKACRAFHFIRTPWFVYIYWWAHSFFVIFYEDKQYFNEHFGTYFGKGKCASISVE